MWGSPSTALGVPPLGPDLRHSSALSFLSPSVTYVLDLTVTVHLFIPTSLSGTCLGQAAGSVLERQMVRGQVLHASGHTQ